MRRASSLWTRRVFAAATIVAVTCFAIAVVLDLAGRQGEPVPATDVAGVIGSVVDLGAWGWSWLGVFTLLATPALGLVATAWEYAAAADRRTAITALGVIGILGVSLAVALLR
jgi:Protein of unknown function (DUF1634)